MSSTREPFDPFLTKLSALTGDEACAPIKDICIKTIKTALDSAKIWEKDIIDDFAELNRTVDELNESGGVLSDFFSTENGEKIAKRVEEIASKVSDFLSSITTSSLSRSSKDELELPAHEEGLQRIAEKIKAWDPGPTPLQMIFNYLDPQLKRCLLCFSAFPEDKVIRRRVMIYWWVGEGLVAPTTDGQTAEQVGEVCFKNLIPTRLIQPIYQKHSKTAKYCKIDPCVRQMLVSKAKEFEEEFFTFDTQGCPTFNSSQCKRACLVAKEEKALVVVTIESKHELRSIFNQNAHYISWDKDQLRELKAIATLQVGRWQYSSGHHIEFKDTKFLDGLQFLKELRYLSLEGISRITELPKTIDGLDNLLILNLRSCHNLEKVTPAVKSITSLTHLDVSECSLLDKMPQGIGSITNLQVLKGFVVGSAQSIDSCRLSELTHLKKLRKLSIRIGSEAAHIGEDLSELSKIKSLQSLKITWGQMKSSPLEIREPKPSSINTMKGSAPSEITELKTSRNKTMKGTPPSEITEPKTSSINATKGSAPSEFTELKTSMNKTMKGSPPSEFTELKTSRTKTMKGSGSMKESTLPAFSLLKLEKLVLECIPDDDSVSWLKPGGFRDLKRLYIAGGKLGKLSPVTENDGWNVEILRLKFLKELKLEWDDLKGKLPQLRCAQIYRCPKIVLSPSRFDDKGYWERNDEEASSSSMAGPSAPVRMRNEAEASSSSLAGTTAPVPIRNEGEASSSSMAGTSTPV